MHGAGRFRPTDKAAQAHQVNGHVSFQDGAQDIWCGGRPRSHVMIPISDENPSRLTPFVTWGIIAACIVAFFWQLSFSEQAEDSLLLTFAFVPRNLFGDVASVSLYGIPGPGTR
jgi:hypothetical protein